MTFRGLYDRIIINQEAIKQGDVNFLPLYYAFPSLKSAFPGFIKGDHGVLSGSTGVGKSKLAHFILNTITNLRKSKHKLKIAIIFNTLEETVEKFKAGYIIEYLAEFGEEVSYYQLLGYSETLLTERQLALAKDATEFYEFEIEPYLTLVTESDATNFYNFVIKEMSNYGSLQIVEIHGRKEEVFIYDDPNQWVIVVSDHIGCYRPRRGTNLYDTLQEFCITQSRVSLGLKYGCVNFLIQQQMKAKEQIEANIKPKTFIEKVKPSIDGLALYKNSADDATFVIGIFDPHRWKEHIPGAMYNGISLNEVEARGQRIRSLCFLKTREGVLEDKELVVGFDGATNQFYELNRF